MARVKYLPYGNGKRVSTQWHRVLTEADRQKVGFTLNSGHRTMAEQQALFNQNMVRPGVPKPGRPMTAVPNPNAPHIREGNPAHALDVNSLDGGEARLERWIERQGANWMNTVPGESWHGEISRQDLARLFRKFRPKPPPRPPQTLSRKGRQFLATQEGVRRYAYNDMATASNPNPPNGNATFGIGKLLHRGPVTDADRRRWGTPQNPMPMAVVWREFDKDVVRYERCVRNSVGRRLPQHRFDALVSLCFNIGTDPERGFPSSTVARELRGKKRGFVGRAADAILLWKKPPELIARRRRERRLFLRGDYGT